MEIGREARLTVAENPDLSVVIPVFNEGTATRGFVQEVLNTLANVPGSFAWEIIVVDDGSTEPLGSISHIGSERIRMVRHERRRGSGAARRTGCGLARGSWIAWIDGDGTYDPKDIISLWNSRPGFDQVVGARTREAGTWRLLRWSVKLLARLLAEVLTRRRIDDLNSGLRVMRRDRMAEWIDEVPSGFSCTSTATLASLKRGHRVKFVPVKYRARSSGSKSKFHPVRDSLRLFVVVLRYGFSSLLGRRSSLTKQTDSVRRTSEPGPS